MNGGSWADQRDATSEPLPDPEKKKTGGGGGAAAKKYGKKVGEGLGKTKAAATTGVKKVKEERIWVIYFAVYKWTNPQLRFEEVLQPGLPWCLGSLSHPPFAAVGCQMRDQDQGQCVCERRGINSVPREPLQIRRTMLFTNSASQIQAYVFDVIRASVPKLLLDDAFEQKNEIAKAVEDELDKTLIVDIEPDEHVKRAMNEINAAARMRGWLLTKKRKPKRFNKSGEPKVKVKPKLNTYRVWVLLGFLF